MIEISTVMYACFIDHSKAFEKVKHNDIIRMLETSNNGGKLLRTIKINYWQHKPAIRIEKSIESMLTI